VTTMNRTILTLCYGPLLGLVMGAAAHAAPAPTQKVQAASAIKWHPGHYMMMRNNHNKDAADLGYVRLLANEPTVVGILRDWKWRDVETSQGVYDFSEMDAYVAAVQSLSTPKRLIIRIENRIFGGQTGHAVPDYMLSDPAYLGGDIPIGNGVAARIWDAPVMDRYIALIQAMAQRYDSNPYVEGISSSESAIGFSAAYPAPATFSNGALVTQLQRYTAAARLAWAHSNIFIETNYLGSDANMQALIDTAVGKQAVVGGPDVIPERTIQSDEIVRGAAGTGTDYRGTVAIKSEVQYPELGQKWQFTPLQLYDIAYNINHANYMLWERNDYYGSQAQQWVNGILPFIRSVNGKTHTACPKSYTGGCATN
jgi:hypothetical protein